MVTPAYLFTDAVLKPSDSESTNEAHEEEAPSLLKVKSPDPTLPGIHIFVDDSNIWIAAEQKSYRVGRKVTKQVKITGYGLTWVS